MGRGSGRSVLGISADYHDAAAAVIVDGAIVAAAEEERFTRVKHDPSMPSHAIEYCLAAAGIEPGELGGVAFYAKPLTAYERILATHARVGPKGLPSLARAISTWSRSKLWVAYRIEAALEGLGHAMPPLTFCEHHQSHAASAFYPSPFDEAAILTIDGVGEWATSSIASGAGRRIDVVREMNFPDSVGLFYSAMTAFCGLEVNDGEFKLMGLAPYGSPRYAEVLRDRVVHVNEDGSIRLDQKWFSFRTGRRMTHPRLGRLLGGPARPTDRPLGQREADIARSTQVILEEIVLAMARHAHDLTGHRRLCMAGGVALNCTANGRLLRDGPFDEVWIQPSAGDGGGALGAALWAWHQVAAAPRVPVTPDAMSGAALGPAYSHQEIAAWLTDDGIEFDDMTAGSELEQLVAAELDAGAIVGWFQGRMEYGPRALGNRSILADARDPRMVARLNHAVKRREGFRPFAPAVLAEHAKEWFEVDRPSPYMLFTAPVHESRRVDALDDDTPAAGTAFADRLSAVRSTIPATTHIDRTARLQTVDASTSPRFHGLLSEFHRRTGCPVLLNTSFNTANEPIVRTPSDAVRCLRETDLDLVALEGCVVRKPAVRAR